MTIFRGLYIATLIEMLAVIACLEVWRLWWVAMPN